MTWILYSFHLIGVLFSPKEYFTYLLLYISQDEQHYGGRKQDKPTSVNRLLEDLATYDLICDHQTGKACSLKAKFI